MRILIILKENYQIILCNVKLLINLINFNYFHKFLTLKHINDA